MALRNSASSTVSGVDHRIRFGGQIVSAPGGEKTGWRLYNERLRAACVQWQSEKRSRRGTEKSESSLSSAVGVYIDAEYRYER